MSIPPGSDLAGVDLSNSSQLPDFGGHDLSSNQGDMATVCDPIKQTGCAAGQKCTLGGSGPECAINGDKLTAQLCGGGTSDDCVAGDLCVSPPSSSILLCNQFCLADNDCKQPAVGPGTNIGHCIQTLTGSSYKICTTPCDPVKGSGAGSGCPTGLACVHASTMTVPELTDCEPMGAKTDMQACADTNECAPGFGCVSVNMAAASCRKVCAALGDCTGGGYMCHKNASNSWGYCF